MSKILEGLPPPGIVLCLLRGLRANQLHVPDLRFSGKARERLHVSEWKPKSDHYFDHTYQRQSRTALNRNTSTEEGFHGGGQENEAHSPTPAWSSIPFQC